MIIGNYETQIIPRLKFIFHIGGWHKNPKPCWYYPTKGWSCDPREIIDSIRMDDDLIIGEK